MTFVQAVQFVINQITRFFTAPVTALEWGLALAVVPAVAAAPFGSRFPLRGLRRAFLLVANAKRLAVVVCGVLPVLLRLSMLGFAPIPDPSIHDEFSHLLLADTLAHGRLTNPTHPMWEHFETIHVIQKPTYNSMYPPAQAVFLAAGEALLHLPWAGVVLSVGLMCAAVCWMMQGWMRPVWAFAGSLLMALKIGVVGFWMNSYMSGAVPAIGGALLMGSVVRLRRPISRPRHAVLFGAGLVILMNSRPFEGALLGLAALVWALPALRRRFQKSPGQVIRAVVWPAAAVFGCGVLFTAYYNWRVTGSPARLPYQVNRDTYGWPENLAFLPPKKLILRHNSLQSMYELELSNRERYSSVSKVLERWATRTFDNWTFLIGPLLTTPLFLFPLVFRHRRSRPLVVFLGLILALNALQLVLYPYHLAPVVPVIFAIVALGVRYLYVALARASRRSAATFAVLLPLGLVLIGAAKQEAASLALPMAYWETAAEGHRDARADIEAWLSARPRRQLVLVRYSSSHSPNQEWVYNHADIDGSKVVWAREIDAASDARLLKYFSDREVWLVEADIYPQRVVPYWRGIRDDCSLADFKAAIELDNR